jgi:NAD(P)-dependent dehydrogenase (short-subunit alcohol dehydrogenase family)
MIDLGLQGKRAVVTGAGRLPARAGHGRLTALALAEAGAHVACVDIDADRAKNIAEEIEQAGGTAVAVVADVRDRDQVRRAFDEAVTAIGGLDVCVDIVGFATYDSLLDVTVEAWDSQLRENLTQVFYVWQEAARRMVEQGTGGSLVALSSVDGTVAAAFHGPYGAAKAGVIHLAKSFSQELGRYGIRANTVAPGNVGKGNLDQPAGEYDVNGINPLAAPRSTDIARSVLFLCSDLSARTSGQTLVVDGGATTAELWGVTEEMLPALRVGLP